MQIVTDTGMDLYLPPEEIAEDVPLHITRHKVLLDGKTYRSGLDIQHKELYELLEKTDGLPTTSVPSTGEMVELYQELAKTDPDIIAIHMSSGLSGTINSAQSASEMVPEANVTVIDAMTLSGVMGWQVAAATRAVKAGWSPEQIAKLVADIVAVSDSIYTLDDLTYLIHGGRISHMKGLIASALKLKPLIGVAKSDGKYEQLGSVRTFKGALKGLVKQMLKRHPEGTHLRVQIIHALNPTAVPILKEEIEKHFKCTWLPVGNMSPVLSAHTGPSMIGLGFASLAEYPEIP